MKNLLDRAHKLIRIDGKTEQGDLNAVKLAGDASLRQYFRLHEGAKCYVLMLTEPFRDAENNFLLVQSLLRETKVPCPEVLAADGAKGAILLEDLSDNTMLHKLGEKEGSASEDALFREAVDLLVDFHRNTRVDKARAARVPGYSLAFDSEKLLWEVDFTLEHLFKSYLKRSIPEKDFRKIRDPFVDICRRLEAEPRVFTHRDYHSRNIMIPPGGGMRVIDFQDARMGLRQYDLASILRDSYYQLVEDRVYSLVDYYLSQVKKKENTVLPREHFVKIFDLMSIQRNFKAIGSFTSFYGTRQEAKYLRFVGNTFENIRRNLMKFPEYEELRLMLFHYYYF